MSRQHRWHNGPSTQAAQSWAWPCCQEQPHPAELGKEQEAKGPTHCFISACRRLFSSSTFFFLCSSASCFFLRLSSLCRSLSCRGMSSDCANCSGCFYPGAAQAGAAGAALLLSQEQKSHGYSRETPAVEDMSRPGPAHLLQGTTSSECPLPGTGPAPVPAVGDQGRAQCQHLA